MSELIASDVQRLEQDAIIVLFELDARQYGEGILRFTGEPVDGGPARMNGYEYQVIPIEAEGFKWDSNSPLPEPTLTVGVVQLAMLSIVVSNGDLIGCPIRRIRTYRKYLDDGAVPDPLGTFPVDHFVVERKITQTRRIIQFGLSVPLDREDKMIPGRQVIQSTCDYRYRNYVNGQFDYSQATCPYTGSACFTRYGVSTPDPSEDECGKRLSDCKLRFGENAELPYHAFPGAGRIR